MPWRTPRCSASLQPDLRGGVPCRVNPRSLYVHVPFDAWLRAVVAELQTVAHDIGVDGPLQLDTIYVGGGTPSLLPPGMMQQLRGALAPFATWDHSAEWTVEANPETLTAELARDWRDAGVNRISVGAQTFHEPALAWMGRMHGADGPRRALDAARTAGIENVSIDLIFGLPDRLGRDWETDLDLALALQPTHISLYGLTAENATPLGRWVAEGREALATEDRYEHEYMRAVRTLTAAGFEHYEVSNFARPGLASRHNSVYWRHEPYIGLGPGAHSYLPPVRSWNVRDWAEYATRVAASGRAVAEDERVEGSALSLERIWLGLRAHPGLRVGTASEEPGGGVTPQPAEGFGTRREVRAPVILSSAQRTLVDAWKHAGLVVENDGFVLPTAEGWMVLDRLAVELSGASDVTDLILT
jgi:oxygen-independent coproporphyrinogen III oxidase